MNTVDYYKYRFEDASQLAKKWYVKANRSVTNGPFEEGNRRDGDMMTRQSLKFYIKYLQVKG